MNRALAIILFLTITASPALAGFLDKVDLDKVKSEIKSVIPKGDEKKSKNGLSSNTIAKGLKEALTVGSKRAVASVGSVDGYLKNPKIKIPLPKKIQKAEKLLRKMKMGKHLDEFILSMNRAAERAAPMAKDIFISAIKDMTLSDAKRILKGSDTEATKYFKRKTSFRLQKAFKPIVAVQTNKFGVTRKYKKIAAKYEAIPFAKGDDLDLDNYVTSMALKGLFTMLAEEEIKIRRNPAKRTTKLIKKVFAD